MRPEIRDILMSVRKPFRYVGGEVGSRRKAWEEADVRVCLAFPDAYELGMSHLGLSILYHIINDEPAMLCERAFMPWADMEAELRRRGMPLFSLESHRPLAAFDIVGFSLGYELTSTNVLAMLALAGIPLRSEARGAPARQGSGGGRREARWPLVIAGGPCAFNPFPVAPFFDAIVIGDGERAIIEIANAVAEGKRSGAPRAALLERLAGIRGVFVPTHQRTNAPTHVGKATIPDLDSAPFPRAPVVAHAATQERMAVEASRGCGRGCRFCQAGFIYRPVRQRAGDVAADLAHRAVAASGAEEFAFLSLSIGDWAPLEGALAGVHARCGAMPVNAALPSLRAEALTAGIMGGLGRARAGSFTLAPEAGTERMRRFINKGNTDADLYASVERIFAGGWHAVKLYFMVGLPNETAADIDGICEIANRCLDIGCRFHRRPDVTVSTSTFVPKANTPLQWERQISIDEALEIQRALKRRLRRPGLAYRWHSAEMSFLEGVLSRGGEELASAIETVFAAGARFDGWDECFDLSRWRTAFARAGLEPESYLRARGRDEPFPWDALGAGPDRAFLWQERERAHALAATPDCTVAECSRCGMCDFKEVRNRVQPPLTHPSPLPPLKLRRAGRGEGRDSFPSPPGGEGQGEGDDSRTRYRLRYTKEGRAAFLGSIEALDALRRGLRASGLPLAYSEGYHPRPRISAGPALPIGIESAAECLDIELVGRIEPTVIVEQLRGRLPDGMEAREAWMLLPPYRSIDASTAATHYEVCVGDRGVIGVAVPNDAGGARLKDLIARDLGVDGDAQRSLRIRKVGVEWRMS